MNPNQNQINTQGLKDLQDYKNAFSSSVQYPTQPLQAPCPACGFCPHCGRSGHGHWGIYSQPYQQPYYWGGITSTETLPQRSNPSTGCLSGGTSALDSSTTAEV